MSPNLNSDRRWPPAHRPEPHSYRLCQSACALIDGGIQGFEPSRIDGIGASVMHNPHRRWADEPDAVALLDDPPPRAPARCSGTRPDPVRAAVVA